MEQAGSEYDNGPGEGSEQGDCDPHGNGCVRRGRIIRQMVVETLLLACLGGIGALLLARRAMSCCLRSARPAFLIL